MMIRKRLLILSAFAVAACVPESAQEGMADPIGEPASISNGVYDQNLAQCGDLNSTTRLTVQGDVFRFYESECNFGRKGGRSDTLEGTLMCMGEGRRFNRDIRMEATGKSLRIIENDASLDYTQCPA